jgi:S1-C subfamily serine protease
MVSDTPPERSVVMVVWRDGAELELSARIGRRKGPWSFDAEGIHAHRGKIPEFDFRHRPGMEAEIFIHSDRPQLGLIGVALTAQMADFLRLPIESGVLVMEVKEDSPAQRAGLKAGDVVTTLGGRSVDNPEQMRRYLSDGEQEVRFFRAGKEQQSTVDLGQSERSSSGALRM